MADAADASHHGLISPSKSTATTHVRQDVAVKRRSVNDLETLALSWNERAMKSIGDIYHDDRGMLYGDDQMRPGLSLL